MNDRPSGKSSVSGATGGNTLYKKDFWSKENLKYSRPHYRLEKSARIINRLARAKELIMLLDVGCGPAALMPLLRSNIHYYGIDIAIHDPAPNLIEADLVNTPVRFDDKRFDIVIAQGFFEYMGTFQDRKFAEISQLLNDGGIFIVTYKNFGHRDRTIYWPYSNVQPLNDFRQGLTKYFEIKRSFPTSHNWHHSDPNRKFIKAANMHINMDVPFISPVLGVQYFFICSKLPFAQRFHRSSQLGLRYGWARGERRLVTDHGCMPSEAWLARSAMAVFLGAVGRFPGGASSPATGRADSASGDLCGA